MASNFGRAASIVLGEHWGKLNDNLPSHIAKFLKNDFLVHYACPFVKEGDVEHAKKIYDISIILPVPPPGADSPPNLEWLILHDSYYPGLREIRDVRLVIGHAPYTAQAALGIRNKYFPSAAYVPLYDSYPVHEIEERLVNFAKEASGAIFIGHKLEEHYQHLFHRHSIEIKYHHVFIPKPTSSSQIKQQSVSSESTYFVFTYLSEQFINENSPNLSLCALAMGKAADDFRDLMDTQLVWVVHNKSSSKDLRNSLFAKAKSSNLQIKVNSNATSNDILSSLNLCHLGLFCCLLSECYDYILCAINAINLSLPLIICDSTNLSSCLKKGCTKSCDYHLTSLPTNCLTEDDYNSAATNLKKQIFKKLNQRHDLTLPNAELLKESLFQSSSSGTIANLYEELITWLSQQAGCSSEVAEIDQPVNPKRKLSFEENSLTSAKLRKTQALATITVTHVTHVTGDAESRASLEIWDHKILNDDSLRQKLIQEVSEVIPGKVVGVQNKCVRLFVMFSSVSELEATKELCLDGTIARRLESFYGKHLRDKFGLVKQLSLMLQCTPRNFFAAKIF